MENNTIKLTEAQIEMLKLSDNDIESGNLISHEQLNEMDLGACRTYIFSNNLFGETPDIYCF
jgi:hypothetical protein